MNVITEILRRVRFLWAAGWILGTIPYMVSFGGSVPLRIIAVTSTWFWLYVHTAWPVRLALTWTGVMCTIAFTAAPTSRDGPLEFFIFAGVGAAIILVVAFLLAPIFKRGD